MPSRSWPHGPVRPDREEINEAIRQLMDEPVSAARTARWHHLLVAWAEADAEEAETLQAA